jgi:2-amino-4-hydroxy-6-hydroxymethyldihydropteridine diphosphokinase
MPQALLGLGANTGGREEYLRAAVAALGAHLQNIRLSRLYESAALLPENAPASWDRPFLNMAIIGQTALAPEALLITVKALETRLGRRKSGHWGPREIDIDILLYEGHSLRTETLTLPHLGLLQRDFALIPAAEVAPDWVHPENGRTLSALASDMQSELTLKGALFP